MYGPIKCPNPACPQSNDVQKVSAIVQAETRQVDVTQYIKGTDVSARARLLAAPAPPANLGRWGCYSIVGLPLLALFGAAAISAFYQEITSRTPIDPTKQTGPGFALGIAVICALGIVGTIVFKVTSAARYRVANAAWQAAMARWNQLYYCNRCGSVFLPGEPGRFAPATAMNQLLWR